MRESARRCARGGTHEQPLPRLPLSRGRTLVSPREPSERAWPWSMQLKFRLLCSIMPPLVLGVVVTILIVSLLLSIATDGWVGM